MVTFAINISIMTDNHTSVKKSAIKVEVDLNEQRQPVGLQWEAEDSGVAGSKAAKALMLAIWDKGEQSTMRIDLWTHEMMVEEMDFFFYETLAGMADTYGRATGDQEMSAALREFARKFGREKKVIR